MQLYAQVKKKAIEAAVDTAPKVQNPLDPSPSKFCLLDFAYPNVWV
jgi:hypothetical protein